MTTPPDLFLVGAAKSGTTSLHHQLAQHPDVFAPIMKETHWAAADLGLSDDRGTTDTDDFLALYANGGRARYRLEGSPSSLVSTVAARRIRELSPHARIVMVLRDPVEVVPALHDQVALGGLQADPDLTRAVAIARQHWGEPLGGLGWHTWTRYLDVVEYAPQVRRFLDVFPLEQVDVLWFDDLKADAGRVFTDLLQRLGLPPTEVDLTPRNTAMQVRSPTLQRWITNPPGKNRLRRVLPTRTARAVRAQVLRHNVVTAQRDPVPADLRRELVELLRPGVDDLATLLERDLDHWARP